MIPVWKLKREVSRFKSQIAAVLEYPLSRWKTKRHDQRRTVANKVENGALAPSPSMAIVLLYQPDGIAQSTFDMLSQFVEAGISPVVVSNTSIKSTDITALLPHCWKIIVRPNFGYDFGGYREGLMQLWDADLTCDEVFILNDSTWLLLDHQAEFLQKLRASDADITGAILRQKGPAQWLESYFYRITGDTFGHESFRSYWRSYLLTSNKYVVIRRGERDFGVAMSASGFTHKALYAQDDLIKGLQDTSCEDMLKTLRYAHYPDQRWQAENAQLIATVSDQKSWHDAALSHIERSLHKGGFNSQFGYASAKILGFPFLKKSSDPVNVGWRQQFIKAVKNGDLPKPNLSMWQELCPMEETKKAGE